MTQLELLNSIPGNCYWYTISKNKDDTETKVLVQAKECKLVFGRIDVLIQPIVGKGLSWVRYDKLELEPVAYAYLQNSYTTFNKGIE